MSINIFSNVRPLKLLANCTKPSALAEDHPKHGFARLSTQRRRKKLANARSKVLILIRPWIREIFLCVNWKIGSSARTKFPPKLSLADNAKV